MAEALAKRLPAGRALARKLQRKDAVVAKATLSSRDEPLRPQRLLCVYVFAVTACSPTTLRNEAFSRVLAFTCPTYFAAVQASQLAVMGITATGSLLWHNNAMKNVGKSSILTASEALVDCLQAVGQVIEISDTSILFCAGDANIGVYLVLDGEVCLQVENTPQLDRFFGRGAVLGLPATFTGDPYRLTAICTADSQLAQVRREEFLDLMQQRPELCQEAAGLLSREVAFIQSALAQKLEKVAR